MRRLGGALPVGLGLLVAFASAASAQAIGSDRLVFDIDDVTGITLYGLNVSDHAGLDVASGDINDDGVHDLIVGARLGDPGGVLNAGESYVFYGPLEPGMLDPSADADVTIHGTDAKGQAGSGLAIADLNDDGKDDLIVGALLATPGEGRSGAGKTYVVFGPIGPGVVDLSKDADIVFEGIAERDHSGISVDGGDLNGDGAADLVIGAVGASPDAKISAGAAFVVFGPLTAGTFKLEQMVDVIIEGIDFGDQLGYGVAVGDVNHDGFQDLVIGAQGVDFPGRPDAGATYVVLGPLAPGRLQLLLEADITFEGTNRGDLSGGSAESGDLNNDGIDDVIVGAQWSDAAAGEDAGQAYVFFGPLGNDTFDLSTADVTYNGVHRRDMTGGGLALGDLDDDGRADLIISAALADGGDREDSGVVYVIFGSSLPFSPAESGGLSTLQVAGIALLAFLIITPVAYWWLRRRPLDA